MSISCSLLLPVCQSPEILLHHCPSSAPPKYSAPRRVYRSRIRSNNIDSDVNISAQLREKKKTQHRCSCASRPLPSFTARTRWGAENRRKEKKTPLVYQHQGSAHKPSSPARPNGRKRTIHARHPSKKAVFCTKKKPTCTAVNTRAVM